MPARSWVRRRARAVRLGLILALGLAGGCGWEPEPEPTPVEGDALVVVGSAWYGHIPAWIGIETGIFQRSGFSVEWRTVGSSAERIESIAAGTAHFASVGEIAMLGAMAAGDESFYWVGNQDIAPGFEGLVARPGISAWEDLKGKTIGFPFVSSVDLTCRLLLKQHGLVPGLDVRLKDIADRDVADAFREGRVDAALVWEPHFTELKAVEGATVLGMDTDTEIYRKYGTMTGPDMLLLSRAWADADPERARRFLAAYFLSVRWVTQNPRATVEHVAGRYLEQDARTLLANLDRFVWHGLAKQHELLTEDGIFAQARHVARILHEELGTISHVPDVTKWVAPNLLPHDADGEGPGAK